MIDPRQEYWSIPYEPVDVNFWDCLACFVAGVMIGILWFGG